MSHCFAILLLLSAVAVILTAGATLIVVVRLWLSKTDGANCTCCYGRQAKKICEVARVN